MILQKKKDGDELFCDEKVSNDKLIIKLNLFIIRGIEHGKVMILIMMIYIKMKYIRRIFFTRFYKKVYDDNKNKFEKSKRL